MFLWCLCALRLQYCCVLFMCWVTITFHRALNAHNWRYSVYQTLNYHYYCYYYLPAIVMSSIGDIPRIALSA
jgi:hypothetical protein